MPAQGLGRCDGCDLDREQEVIPIAMPAQGLGRCDYRSRLLRTRAVRIAMPAQGLGRCDTRIYEKGGHVPGHRNARAGAWTLRLARVRGRAGRVSHRNARAGAWTLRPGFGDTPKVTPSDRNARAGAWTLRPHQRRHGRPPVGIAMPAQGLGRCDEQVPRIARILVYIAMPAQGLGRCDSTCRRMVSQPFADRNARAGAWTLRLVDTTLTANVDTVIAMPAQGLGRCDVREHAIPHAKVGRSQCPRRGLDAATCGKP